MKFIIIIRDRDSHYVALVSLELVIILIQVMQGSPDCSRTYCVAQEVLRLTTILLLHPL